MSNSSDGGRCTPTVLLTGTPGAGKSIVAKEIHELLRLAGVANAMIDLDAVGRTFPAADGAFNSRFVVTNLEALWPTYESLEIDYLVLARMLLSATELEDYRARLPRLDLRVVRLEVPGDVVHERLKQREPGVSQGFLLRVSQEIDDDLQRQHLEDFLVNNDATRSVTDVAIEVLETLAWPIPQPHLRIEDRAKAAIGDPGHP